MPLDTRVLSLRESLELCGIRVVPDEVLAAHKAEQLKLHQGSRLLPYAERIRDVVALTFFGGIILFVSATLMYFATGVVAFGVLSLLGSLGVGCAMVSIPLLFRVRLKSPAEWRESIHPNGDPLPRAVVNLLQHPAFTSGFFVFGTLYQHETVLDPYLLLCRGSQRVCLAIWDGDKVLHIADVAN